LSEKRLIRRLQNREERAFTELVVRYQGPMFNLCFRMLGNAAEAEDIAQETFVKAFKGIARFRGDSSLGTWLYRIAVNLCKNRLKYLSRRHYSSSQAIDGVPERAWARSSQPTLGEAAPAPDQALSGSRAEKRVQDALAAVDAEFRELLVLRDIQGLSYVEVVRVTGLPEGTVKSRLHRARAALRRAYETLEGEG
jgi:RNA polymerase sigma-70 factor, ECF subfamily